MANAFLDCRQIESTSISILEQNNIIGSVVKRMGGDSYSHITDKATQLAFGDVAIPMADGSTKYIELKSEVRHTGNLFIETWSNYSPESESAIYNKREWTVPELPMILKRTKPELYERLKTGTEPGITSKVGWLDKLDSTDILIYHFLDKNRVYVISWKAFKTWLFEKNEDDICRATMLWHAPMGKQTFRQRNRTWGLIVPVADLKNYPDVMAVIDVPAPAIPVGTAA